MYRAGVLGVAAALVALVTGSAQAQSCEERFAELNDRFTAAYLAIDADCRPEVVEPLPTEPGCSVSCKPELSPECLARYDAVSIEAGAAWAEFYGDCPDHGNVYSPGSPETVSDRSPTKQELFAETVALRERTKELKQQLRRAWKRSRRLARQCGR